MAAKKVGTLIKSARTEAGFTQEQLAKKIPGLSAADISKAERGEMELTQDQLKAIAKLTGVTQKSLLEAAGSKTTAKKPSSTAKTTAKSSTTTSMKVTAAEKKLLELYREADSETKKSVIKTLKGETTDAGDLISSLLGSVVGQLGKK